MDLSKKLEEKLYPSYVDTDEVPFQIHLGHRKVNWSDQIQKGVVDMMEQKIFEYQAGRRVSGYTRKSRIDFPGLRKFVKKQSRLLNLYVQETY